jgi:hypothetical protein
VAVVAEHTAVEPLGPQRKAAGMLGHQTAVRETPEQLTRAAEAEVRLRQVLLHLTLAAQVVLVL